MVAVGRVLHVNKLHGLRHSLQRAFIVHNCSSCLGTERSTNQWPCMGDYQPIPVTPLLGYVVLLSFAEQLLARNWLYVPPAAPSAQLVDQCMSFAHPTAQLLLAKTLRTALPVSDVSQLRSKFDVVDNEILSTKIATTNLSPGLSRFLLHHKQQCKFNGALNDLRPISKGIVQGSAIGPVFYIITKGDLRPLAQCNVLCKYADDTELLVPD